MRRFYGAAFLLLLSVSVFSQSIGGLFSEYHDRVSGNTVDKKVLAKTTKQTPTRINLNDHLSDYEVLEKNQLDLQSIINNQPEFLDIFIPGEMSVAFKLYKEDIRAAGYVVRTGSGQIFEPNLNNVFYRGYVEGYPRSLVALSVIDEEFKIMYSYGSGNYWIHLTKDDLYIHYSDKALLNPKYGSCATDDEAHLVNPGSFESAQTESLGSCVHIYLECDNQTYLDNGSSVANTESWANANLNEVSTLYTNDGFSVFVSEIKVWDIVDPYAGQSSTGGMLTVFGQTIQNDYNGRLAHLLTTRGVGGGIAWVGVLCSQYNAGSSSGPYAVSGSLSSSNPPTVPTFSWNVEVIAHEMGHNWGSPHTHACNWNGDNTRIDNCGGTAGYPEGSCSTADDPPLPDAGTIMSYCHLVGGIGIDFSLGFSDGDPAGTGPLTLMTNAFNNATCYTGGDCGSGTPSCSDGIQNFGELGVECGGNLCPDCVVVNDDCDGAKDVSSRINAGSGIPANNSSNALATSGTPTPSSSPYSANCNTYMSWCNNTNHNDIWFKLTIPAGSEPMGLLTVSTLGTSWDTQLAIWEGGCTGTGVPPATFLSANDDFHGGGANNWTSKTTVMVIPGNEYFIQVDGYNSSNSGDVNFDIEYFPISGVASQTGSLVSANWEGRGADGWTHYVNTVDNTVLLSVNKDDQLMGWLGIDGTSCRVQANTGATNLGSSGCGAPYIENQPTWAVMNRTWDLNPATQPGTAVDIRAYYSSADLTDVQSILATATHANMSHYKINAPGEEDLTVSGNDCHQMVGSEDYNEFDPGSYTYGTYATNGHYAQYAVSSFSGGGGGAGGGAQGALPITLLSFDGEAKERYNRIFWSTSSEINNEWMIVERSSNGYSEWTEIGRVQGNILSNKTLNYSLDDLNPSVLSYYRLQSIDVDGKVGYSEVISLRRNTNLSEAEFSVFPVPADQTVNLQYTGKLDDNFEMIIRDMSGKLISQNTINPRDNNGIQQIQISDYDKGVYIITLTNGDFSKVLKFTKT